MDFSRPGPQDHVHTSHFQRETRIDTVGGNVSLVSLSQDGKKWHFVRTCFYALKNDLILAMGSLIGDNSGISYSTQQRLTRNGKATTLNIVEIKIVRTECKTLSGAFPSTVISRH